MDGILGAEFSIQVTNPTGYAFSYTPPVGSFSSGNPIDVTPANPSDRTGTTILLPACQPAVGVHRLGDRIQLGRISVLNYAGTTTDLVVTKKVPSDDAGMPVPRFFLCDAPFMTPIRMAFDEGGSASARMTLNSEACGTRPSVPVGLTSTLLATLPQSVRLSWQAPIEGHVASYNLYRTSGSLNVVRLNTSPILGTTITFNPTSGDCYRVSAVDAGGREGPLSDPACETLFSEETLSFDSNDA